ncbi:MAG: hypothetical protein PVH75_09350 [Syntrophobacterales bacterium]|jgi:hypothetical protein
MAESIVVFIIAGVALALSARWFYRTLAEKSEGCGCGERSCPTMAPSNRADDSNYCKEP